MNVAFISYEFPPDNGKGGIGTYVKQVAGSMAKAGYNIHVFAGSPHRNFNKIIDGYKVHGILCESSLDFRYKVTSIFDSQHLLTPFQLIESAEINGNGWEIKKKYPDLPLVVRLHAPNYLVENLKKRYVSLFSKLRFLLGAWRRLKWDLGYWKKYNKLTDADYQFIQLADYITAPSASMKNWAVTNWHIEPAKIAVIPNIFLPSNDLLQLPVYKETLAKRIIFFGRLNVLKGLVNATKAIKKILKEFPEWQFRVIGDDGNGPHHNATMKQWMQGYLKPVLHRVEFIDGLDYESIPEAIKEAEIVLLPSLFESFSYTCAEAMAAGKAIVGGNNGGMRDLLVDQQSGFLIDPENENEIYKALKQIINNNKLRYNLSVKARKRIVEEFDTKVISAKFVAYYKNVIQSTK